MKNFTLTILFLSLLSLTNWGQCNLDTAFIADLVPNNNMTYNFYVQDTSNICSTHWDFGDNNTSSSSIAMHTYAQAGTYTVCLIMGACDSICYDTLCQTITVTNSTPCNIDASFTIDTAIITQPLSYTFSSVEDTNGTNVCDVEWNFGDGSSNQFGWQLTHTYSQPGTYTVCSYLINCVSGCSDTVCQTIVVSNNPAPCNISANYNWFQAYDSLNGSWINTVYIIDYSTGTNLTYVWDFGDGTTSNQQYPTHNYTAIGQYSVCLTITGDSSCTSTYCDSIVVQTKASGFTLSVISQEEAAVGIEEPKSIEFGKIYPNPTSDNSFISINSLDNSKITISIIDITGKIISKELNNLVSGENTIQLNTQNLTNGMYFISISDGENSYTNLRLIKK